MGGPLVQIMHQPLLQVLEHEKHKEKPQPSIMQRIQALQAAEEEEDDTATSVSRTSGSKCKPQVAVITATGKLSCERKPLGMAWCKPSWHRSKALCQCKMYAEEV